MAQASLKMDFSEFNDKFGKYSKVVLQRRSKKGIREALQELKRDADEVPPKTPHLEGHLRGSGVVEDVRITMTSIAGTVRYRTPYAVRWHEAVGQAIKWSEPGVGPKYLSSKVIRFRKKYIRIVADAIRMGI